jgi:hypothetical protein
VSHCGLAIYIKKVSLGKRRIFGDSDISPCKKHKIQKNNHLKETKILQDIITL